MVYLVYLFIQVDWVDCDVDYPGKRQKAGALRGEELKKCREASVVLRGSVKIGQLFVEDKMVKLDKDIKLILDLVEGKMAELEGDVNITNIVDFDSDIKITLNMSNLQIGHCSDLVNCVLNLKVTSLMLKKQPSIVLTMLKLKNYVNHMEKEWDEERKQMMVGIQLINSRSNACYSKFIMLFPEYDPTAEMDFFSYFQEQLDMFRMRTKELEEMRYVSLTEEDIINI